jgi:hypothetical protein
VNAATTFRQKELETAKREAEAILESTKDVNGVLRAITRKLKQMLIDVLTAMRKAQSLLDVYER